MPVSIPRGKWLLTRSIAKPTTGSSPTRCRRSSGRATPQGRLEWVNDRWMELTGLSEEESLHDKGALVAVHPDDRGAAPAALRASARDLQPRARSSTGSGPGRAPIASTSAAWCPSATRTGAITRWVAAAFDMHDRRQAEEALRASERRFETVFHLNPQPTAITRLADGTYLSVNDAFLKMTGYSRDEVVGKTAVELGIWTARAARRDRRAPARRPRPPSSTSPIEPRTGARSRSRSPAPASTSAASRASINVATDVTERRANEAALRQSEALARARADELAALMDAVPAAVWISQDPDCREMRGNRTGRELLRIDPGQNLSKTAADPTATRHFKVFVERRGGSARGAPAAASGARRRGEKPRRGDPLRRRAGGPPVRQRRPAARSERRAAGGDRRLRRRDAAQAGGGRDARGRSPKGRIPGAAVARAAQPARADPHRRPAHAAARRRGDAARARGDPPSGPTPRAPRRRPARRLARGARQGHAREEAARARERGGEGGRSDGAAARAAAAPAPAVRCRPKGCRSRRTRCASRRWSTICSRTPRATRRRAGASR